MSKKTNNFKDHIIIIMALVTDRTNERVNNNMCMFA